MRSPSARRRGIAALGLAAAVLVAPLAAGATAAEPAPQERGTAPTAGAVFRIEDRAARTVAASLADRGWRATVREAALTTDAVNLSALADRSGDHRAARRLEPALDRAEAALTEAKGLDGGHGPLLRLRLADDAMRDALAAGTAPLVTTPPSDDDASSVTAYDSRGRAVELDLRTPPERPVYVLDTDASRALAAGLDVLREELAAHGLSGAVRTGSAQGREAQAAQAGFWSTRITSVRLSDDKEPWVKGDSEIYSLVTGFGHDGKVRVDPVDMPYLDEDGRTYYPDQILVNWSYYKYNLADAVMMEEDGGTNYRELAKALTTALLTITDQGMYIPLVNALLDAMPDDWWTDDPDYVDSWYTLARQDSGSLTGAAGNGRMTVEPYFVDQF
ncbi:DUF3103 family protein [Streptomyces sp. JJ36]|uniref:DUF3103 family protein n=1 Tax=Streptomyces sp. JJ36 TaxID=2736645 RepID=UPI001F1ED267|nr:DUF3103 family protein [Streptomyces sp. JJ36]MCF6523166.1 DUF3103 family protein [Streptomyces sp. JJ36]